MDSYKKILKSWEVPHSKSTEEAWKQLESKIASGSVSTGKVVEINRKPLFAWTAAAAAVIALAVFFWPAGESTMYSAQAGEIKTITLPDNSTMTLNAESGATINDNWAKERKIELKGEAFFEVVKGTPFSVLTDNGMVEVLGTSFDVKSRDKSFEVKCSTGKVRVRCGKSQVEITPGSLARLENGKLVVATFDKDQKDFRNGEFSFEEAPLSEVFDEFERQFNVKVEKPDLTGKFYTGRFSNKDLEQALKIICIPMNLSFEIQDDKVIKLTFKDAVVN